MASSELPKFNPEDLVIATKPEASSTQVAKQEAVQTIDYKAFFNEVQQMRSTSNKLRTEYEIQLLSEDAKSHLFLFKDTVKIKRNALVSNEMGCWFEPKPGIEVFARFPEQLKTEFFKVEEYDFITCLAKLVEFRNKMIFEVTEMISVEPFDASADFVEYNTEIDQLKKMFDELLYFKYKDKLSEFALAKQGKLGIITGKMISLERDSNTNQVVMMMDYGDLPIEIICHSQYLEVLLDLKYNSRISMAVVFSNADARKGYRFERGCMVQLRDVQAKK